LPVTTRRPHYIIYIIFGKWITVFYFTNLRVFRDHHDRAGLVDVVVTLFARIKDRISEGAPEICNKDFRGFPTGECWNGIYLTIRLDCLLPNPVQSTIIIFPSQLRLCKLCSLNSAIKLCKKRSTGIGIILRCKFASLLAGQFFSLALQPQFGPWSSVSLRCSRS
jgi:hypothetical protein